MPDDHPPLVVLGAGYTGRVIYHQALQLDRFVLAASRAPEIRLADLPSDRRLRFDLSREETWSGIPEGADLVWTFPALPLEAVRSFGEQAGQRVRRLVILGSTSAYDRSPQAVRGDLIDEACPVDVTIPRVQGEECLRTVCGAIILRVAGIYGPKRHPLEWIRRGRVGYSDRFVNLIHVEDLAGICLQMLERGNRGESYNVSDGTPRRWSDIVDIASARWGIARPTVNVKPDKGKRIDSRKVRDGLGYTLRHPDLYAALHTLEQKQVAGSSPREGA